MQTVQRNKYSLEYDSHHSKFVLRLIVQLLEVCLFSWLPLFDCNQKTPSSSSGIHLCFNRSTFWLTSTEQKFANIKSSRSIQSKLIWSTSALLWKTVSSMVNVRSVLPKTNSSLPFAAKMCCFEFCNVALVACCIVSYSVRYYNVSVAPVSITNLACILFTLTLIYKPDSSNDDPTQIDPFGLQTGWSLLSILMVIFTWPLLLIWTVTLNVTFLVASISKHLSVTWFSVVIFTSARGFSYLQLFNFISHEINVSLHWLHPYLHRCLTCFHCCHWSCLLCFWDS